MSPERWRRIGELFDTAVSVPPSERMEWLHGACDGDDDLRAEVANLLAQDARAEQSAFLSKWDDTERSPRTDAGLALVQRPTH